MSSGSKRVLLLFRRDLRLHDNRAVRKALRVAARTASRPATVNPVFIFDPRQCDASRNAYFNHNAFRFMIDSLTDLETELASSDASAASATATGTSDSGTASPLTVLFGESHAALESLLNPASKLYVGTEGSGDVSEEVAAVVCNTDITPFARERDAAIAEVCARYNVKFVPCHHDGLLQDPDTVRTASTQNVYKVFTPFYRACLKKDVARPVASWPPTLAVADGEFTDEVAGTSVVVQRLPLSEWANKPIDTGETVCLSRAEAIYDLLGVAEGDRGVAAQSCPNGKGGRTRGLELLSAAGKLKKYGDVRDDVTLPDDKPGSTKLGPHLKFGTVGVREAHDTVKGIEPLLRQLYWREFYSHLAFNFPSLLSGQVSPGGSNGNMNETFNDIWWDTDEAKFQAWCEGKTGFPMVDAGMRQMLATGDMHNRARMITACFLTKDLHIDWRRGEKFFAQNLTDYDAPNNNGGWQWAASTGADSQPYFRIFHPTRQLERWDKKATYVKRWIPELVDVPAADILAWEEKGQFTSAGKKSGYPAPIVDHSVESKKAISLFAEVAQKAKAARERAEAKRKQDEADSKPTTAKRASSAKKSGTSSRGSTKRQRS